MVGDPRPNSLALAAVTHLAHQLSGEPDLVVDAASHDPAASADGLAATKPLIDSYPNGRP